MACFALQLAEFFHFASGVRGLSLNILAWDSLLRSPSHQTPRQLPGYALTALGQRIKGPLVTSCFYQRGFHLMRLWNGFDAAC